MLSFKRSRAKKVLSEDMRVLVAGSALSPSHKSKSFADHSWRESRLAKVELVASRLAMPKSDKTFLKKLHMIEPLICEYVFRKINRENFEFNNFFFMQKIKFLLWGPHMWLKLDTWSLLFLVCCLHDIGLAGLGRVGSVRVWDLKCDFWFLLVSSLMVSMHCFKLDDPMGWSMVAVHGISPFTFRLPYLETSERGWSMFRCVC